MCLGLGSTLIDFNEVEWLLILNVLLIVLLEDIAFINLCKPVCREVLVCEQENK